MEKTIYDPNPELRETVQISVPKNGVYLSFWTNDDAEPFWQWWKQEGNERYAAFLAKVRNQDEYDVRQYPDDAIPKE